MLSMLRVLCYVVAYASVSRSLNFRAHMIPYLLVDSTTDSLDVLHTIFRYFVFMEVHRRLLMMLPHDAAFGPPLLGHPRYSQNHKAIDRFDWGTGAS